MRSRIIWILLCIVGFSLMGASTIVVLFTTKETRFVASFTGAVASVLLVMAFVYRGRRQITDSEDDTVNVLKNGRLFYARSAGHLDWFVRTTGHESFAWRDEVLKSKPVTDMRFERWGVSFADITDIVWSVVIVAKVSRRQDGMKRYLDADSVQQKFESAVSTALTEMSVHTGIRHFLDACLKDAEVFKGVLLSQTHLAQTLEQLGLTVEEASVDPTITAVKPEKKDP